MHTASGMSNCPTLNDGPGMEQISSGPVDFVARCVQARAIERDINRDRERERETERTCETNQTTHIHTSHRDAETQRHADTRTCRHADTQTHRHTDTDADTDADAATGSDASSDTDPDTDTEREREREREREVLGELLRRVSCEEPDSTCLPLNGIVISLLYYTCFALVQLQTCEGI